ncbi:hypothetical protein DXG01_005718 [Tephrocybe rancida]|nr:hypothetical protein DXG01_005718 [Tephrocybe rancida]
MGILVRDDHALQKLYGQVGDIGLIMTLYDSKGLEFNDVLLYDFFEDSPVLSSQWRLLLSADVMDQNSSVAPHFNEIRHASICAELKFLYVAITRARKNLWIADQSEKGEPMRLFWTGRDQIHNCTPGSDMPQLAVASSREEWESKGKELFERKKYLQAKHCYERAAMAHHMAISDAYYLRDQARKAPVGDSRQTKSQRDTAFLTAANAFLTCAKEAPKNSLVYFRRTAECFEAGKDDLRAAETYLDFVHDYDTAATIFRKLGLFDKAISVIDTYEHHMEKDLVNNIKVVARLYYFREEKLDKARHLFATDEEELEYLEDLDLDVARAEVLVSLGRRGEAAELHISEGRRFEAIPLFLEDRQKPDSMLRAAQCILSEMWCHTTFDTLPEQGQALSKLLEWSTHVRVEVINDKDQNELSMFKAIVLHDTLELARLSSIFLYAGNTRAAILCLNHYFREFPVVATLSGQGLAKILQLFLTYIWILHDLVYRSLDPSTEALFGIERISTGEYFLPGGTFLHHNLGLLWSSRKRSAEAGSSINGFNLDRLLKQAIFAHLRRKISEQNIVCRHAPQFFPCISFLALGYCNREQCPQGHATPTLELYNTHVRLHLQQIQIIQISVFVGSITGGEISLRKRQCINQLYEALNPPWHHLTQSLLREDLIPEFSKSIIILKDWLRAFAHTLNFRLSPAIFLTQMLCATRLSLALDKQNALFYIYHSPYLQAQPVQYLQPNGSYILHDLLSSLVGEGRQGSFHGIVLPRSWLLRFDKKPEQAIKRETHISYLLIEPLRKLLEIIHTGAGAEYLGPEESSSLAFGYNTRNLRVDIFNSIRSLYRADVNFPAIYRQYVLARNWDELSRALRDTRRSVLVDELVQMHDLARGPVFYRAEFGVRVVPYKGYGDIARALGMPAPAVAAAEAQNANEELSAIATVAPEGHDAPVVVLSKSPVVGNEAEADMDSPHDIHVFDADEEEEVNLETSPPVASQAPRSTEHLAAAVIQRAYRRAVLQRQTRAVIVIQQAYRRILSRRQGVPKTRLSGKFSACLEIAHDASLKAKENRHYCQHILGPLPHILLCLDVGLTSAKSQKAIAKKLFQTARHETLGEVGERMTELSRLLKVLTQAQKLLEPSSDVHGRCNIVELRRLVKETAEHLKNLPFEVPDSGGFHDDLDIAVKGIVAEKKPPKARSKPALVWDEDGDQ